MQHSTIPLWESVWSIDAAGSHVAYLSESEGGREVRTAGLSGDASPRRLTRFTAAIEERLQPPRSREDESGKRTPVAFAAALSPSSAAAKR